MMSDEVVAFSRTPDEQAALAREHAPVLVIHPDDPWKPIDVAPFLQNCELLFETEGLPTVTDSPVEVSRLGRASAFDAYSGQAGEVEREQMAWHFTRPFSKSKTRDDLGLAETSGFSLRRTAMPSAMPLEDVPMWFEWRSPTTLIFWYFMPGSSLPQDMLETILSRLGLGLAALEVQPGTAPEALDIAAKADIEVAIAVVEGLSWSDEIHQGDWEGVTFEFEDETPIAVTLHQHGKARRVAYTELENPDGRVVLYCGKGSHSTVASPETAGAEIVTRDGLRWQPDDDHVRDVWLEPWYGFGGAWGQTRLPPLGTLGSGKRNAVRAFGFDVWEESTGPLGPSPYKAR
jgi:hypothetical protein